MTRIKRKAAARKAARRADRAVLTTITRRGASEDVEMVTIRIGNTVFTGPGPSADEIESGLRETQRMLDGLERALHSLPGIVLDHGPDVPLFYADPDDPLHGVIRDLHGKREAGRFLDGEFRPHAS